MENECYDIPIIIGGKEIRTGNTSKCIKPHDHQHILAEYHQAGMKEIEQAINVCMESWYAWSETPLNERTEIFKRAAKLLSGTWRDTLNAATMLNQSKNVFQSEIDAACELIDFFNFNSQLAEEIYSDQPLISPEGMRNSLDYRSLEGFIFAVSPFNFTSIAGNLPTAPAIMGNVAIWKPASSSVYSGYFIMKLLQEAGLPDGIINFLPGIGKQIGGPIINNSFLAGIHFTGSTGVFQHLWSAPSHPLHDAAQLDQALGQIPGQVVSLLLAHR